MNTSKRNNARVHIDLKALRETAERHLGTPVPPHVAADMVIVARRSWQRWENEGKSVPVGVIKRFCAVTGLDAHDWIPQ